MNIHRIRAAEPSDIREIGERGIRDLYNEVRRAERAQGRSPLAPPQYASWCKAMQSPENKGVQLVAEDTRGHIIGFVLAAPKRGEADAMSLQKLVVASDKQGEGIGRELLAKVVNYAQHQGKKQLHVTAEQGEGRASGFYQRCGFSPSESYSSASGVPIDRLRLDLTQALLQSPAMTR